MTGWPVNGVKKTRRSVPGIQRVNGLVPRIYGG
jgi:hypothetical protein